MNSSTEQLGWKPQRPRLRVVRLVATWTVSAAALLLAADLLPTVTIHGFWGARSRSRPRSRFSTRSCHH